MSKIKSMASMYGEYHNGVMASISIMAISGNGSIMANVINGVINQYNNGVSIIMAA
jgi:hypothetical protein